MAQPVRHKPEERIPFQERNTVTRDITTGPIYREFALEVEGEIDIAGADNVTGNLDPADELAVLPEIQLKKNQGQPILTVSGYELAVLQYFLYGRMPTISSELGNGEANPTFKTYLMLPMIAIGNAVPFDTALNTQRNDINSLQLSVRFADSEAIYSQGGGGLTNGFTSNVPDMNVFSKHSFGYQGPPFDRKKITRHRDTITATTDNFRLDFDEEIGYESFLIHTTADGADNPNVINNVKLKSGSNNFQDRPIDELREVFRTRNNISEQQPFRRSNHANRDAWYMLRHPTDGLLSEIINAENFSELFFEMDVDASVGSTVELETVARKFNLATNIDDPDGAQ